MFDLELEERNLEVLELVLGVYLADSLVVVVDLVLEHTLVAEARGKSV